MTTSYPRLMPNGDVIAVINIAAYTPWGLAIVKVDKDSNLLWTYTRQAHHDLDIDNEGNIYAMTHTVVNTPWPGLEKIETPFLDDQIAVLNPNGEEIKVVSILDAIQGSEYESLLIYARTDMPKGDLMHVNSVKWLDEEDAKLFPGAKEGNVLISIRQLDVLAVMDLEKETINWALRGPWRLQHDPDLLDNGNLLIFDNRGDLKNNGGSRVIEFNPQTLEISWEFPGDTGERLYSSIYGSQQRLPNGNTLISESNNGRILEVTHDKEIAWEYKIPERKISRFGDLVATVIFAHRFSEDELPFLQEPQ